ncbi:MAG: hypothetical protein IIV96_05115, partial [Ruminococcus sp.]|nr:hypothetical protein [Ruminococcus sp.]
MKKLIIIPVFIIAVCVSAFSVRAEEINYDMSGIYDSLSDDAKAHMLSLGADSADASDLSDLSFDTVLAEIGKMAAENLGSPLRGLISITAMLLICSMLTAYKGSLSTDMGTALDIILALCLSAAVAIPAAELIKTAGDVIVNASNLMLAYIPVTALLLTASGSIAGSAAYYASIIGLGEGVLQLSSRVIIPFMYMLLGICIAGGVSSGVNLGGFSKTLSKASKWLLGFMMALFSAVLGIRQVLSNSLDSVSGRAARFAVSSFVPVVGSAIGEALKTIQGSVSVLKSGVGVFVIIALAVTFLPLLLRAMLWIFTL